MTQESERTTDTVLTRFEHWARTTPDTRAVLSGTFDLSYGELDRRANRLARHLLDAGLPAGATVAVGTARRADAVLAVLAVLKAGGTYALLDPDSPGVAEHELRAARPFALVTHTSYRARLDHGQGLLVVCLDAEAQRLEARSTEPVRAAPAPDAAVLFTRSDRPRAVPVSQARLLAAFEAWARVGAFTAEDRHLVTARADVTDFSAGWTRALCSGGGLAVSEGPHWMPHEIRRRIGEDRVTVVHADPGTAQRLAGPPAGQPDQRRPEDDLAPVRLLSVTGDRLFLDEQAELALRLRTGVRLLQVWATTEAAGCGTWFELSQLPRPEPAPRQSCLIGTPFPGCRAEVRDGELHLSPPEGGDLVPTGDHGLLRPDGLLEFTGRDRDGTAAGPGGTDLQKIEAVVRSREGTGSALVRTVSAPGGRQRLVAYLAPYTLAPSGAHPGLPDAAGLRAYLRGRLPDDQIPQGVVHLETLPRTRTGREDRDGLPLPAQPARAGTGRVKFAGRAVPGASGGGLAFLYGCLAIFPGALAFLLTLLMWPRSVDLTAVPSPWAGLFFVLYLCECLAFGVGVVVLCVGRRPMLAQGRPRGLTTAAHLALVYLLASWWPQDNLYRLADKYDYPRQALLVYLFNIPLMIAAFVLAVFVTRPPEVPFDFDDD
ncbi:AMP-binding protein [Streptomyces sp. WAC06614]|uniref:AMP-binding protein n=1 Tax=Streptomyces sp. WAC06614 TaxID=2487416 RepID=UPI000F797819|nr:AMP-binding protein [Streptomyces sp. WAC06614]RSS74805.1 hypothetical protein EF918_24345 [Streptomyces sp. WAC06614]